MRVARRRASARGAARVPAGAHHLVDGVAVGPVEVASGELARGDDAVGVAGAAGPERNAGMLVDTALVPRKVGARCDARGLLLIAPTPRDAGPFVLPGGNFHVYDYSLFWANVRADVEARLSALAQARLGPPLQPQDAVPPADAA